jgi:hypothetical protein
VANIQLFDLGDGRNRRNVFDRQAMSGVDREPDLRAVPSSLLQRSKGGWIARRVGVRARVELDGKRAELSGSVDCVEIRADEKARPKSGRIQPSDAVGDSAVIA